MINQNSLENKNNPNKKVLGIIVLIVVLAIGGYFVFKNKTAPQNNTEQDKQEVKKVITPQIARTSADKLQKEMPQSFPKEIPLNGKTKIIESYSATYPNVTAKQSTVSFESKNTPKENYDLYEKWAKENKWKILNSSKQENLMSLYGQKNQTTFNITINPKTSSGAKSGVNITYAEI